MAATKSQQNAHGSSGSARSRERVESPREIIRDVVEYITEYARQKPGHAALACVAVGFVLGFHLFIIVCNSDGTWHESPIVTSGIVQTHAHALAADRLGQLANDVAGRVLSI